MFPDRTAPHCPSVRLADLGREGSEEKGGEEKVRNGKKGKEGREREGREGRGKGHQAALNLSVLLLSRQRTGILGICHHA